MHRRCLHWILAQLALWACLAQAQSPEGEPTSPAPLPEPAPFEGRDWRLSAYWDGARSVEVLKEGRPAVFRFAEGQLSGSTGCNRIQGQYRVEGEHFQLVSGLAATRMRCPEPIMHQESRVLAHLQAAARYRLILGRLELTDESGRTLLSFLPLLPDPGPQALVGPTWFVERYAGPQGSWVRPRARIELSLDPQGQLSGFDGCNRYLSGFKRSGHSLAIGPIATTGTSCTSGREQEQQAREFRAALAQVQAYRIAEGQLILFDAAGRPLIELRPSSLDGQGGE